ncbi:shikimate kinase [Actinoplanes sp. NPDC049802]|uniref:shikimate kinase n=1 Tax=Actinoplanes sp. NPDC049802 TaxID=3154742 RepID=UPI0034091F00
MKSDRPLCVLVGPPGAGKTTVGRLVAGSLDAPFLDTDDMVADLAGKPIAEILFDEGEAALRSAERAAVIEALAAPSAVVALGSGAVLDPDVQTYLADHFVIHLAAQLATVTRRTAMTSGGQIAGIGVRSLLRTMLDERSQLYRRLASITIATDDRTPEAAATEVKQALRLQR